MPDPSITSRLDLATQIAREAGRITLKYFRSDDLRVERKADDSPVTVADRQAEEHLRRRIAEAFPDDGIVGEELEDRPGSSGFRWILDPIDGTKSFIHGVPLYGTLVAVQRDEQSVAGVIHIPVSDESVHAAIGGGAWYTSGEGPPRRTHVSDVGSLSEGLFVTTEVRSFEETGRRAAYDRLEATARLTRTWGDCFGYFLLATGRAELMVDPIVAIWDTAALPPIVNEAGGCLTDWQGRETIDTGEAIATNGRIHAEVLALL